MEHSEIVNQLKQEAQLPVSNALFHAFAMRKRARGIVTTNALAVYMKKEGYKYTPSDYAPTLKTLSDLGLGTLILNKKGRVKGLRHISVTLKSIGDVALGNSNNLSRYYGVGSMRTRPNQLNLVATHSSAPRTPVIVEKKPEPLNLNIRALKINFEVLLHGNPVNISAPQGLNVTEIVDLITKIQSA